MAVSAKELEVIRADVTVGKSAMQTKDNPVMVSMAAYHFAQAIEKSVKAVIRENADEPVSPDTLYTHNMEHLLVQAERHSAGFIQNHLFIADNAATLSAFNGMRYGNKTISVPDAYVLMANAEKLMEELEQAYMQENQVSKSEIQKQAKVQMRDATQLSLDDRNSHWKRTPPQNKSPHKPNKHRTVRYSQKPKKSGKEHD